MLTLLPLMFTEWEPNYQPKQMETPGLGIKDFVDDVGHIYQNRHGRRKSRRRVARRKKGSTSPKFSGNGVGSFDGLYHQPGLSGSGEIIEEEDDYDNTVNDSISENSSLGHHHPSVRFGETPSSGGLSSPEKRDRFMSDGTGGGFGADDEDSDDLELL